MIIKNISATKRTNLYLALDANLSSFRKRSMLYTIAAHSDSVANISFYLTGEKGTVVKELTLVFDKLLIEWNVYSEGKQYTLVSLSELSSVIRSMIAKMTVTVNKI